MTVPPLAQLRKGQNVLWVTATDPNSEWGQVSWWSCWSFTFGFSCKWQNGTAMEWEILYSLFLFFFYICDWEMVLKEGTLAVCLGARAGLFILWSNKLNLGLLFTTICTVLLILKCLISRFPKCCSLCPIAVSPQMLPVGSSLSPLSKSMAPSPEVRCTWEVSMPFSEN